ncbi:hypothetical protein Trydic_g3566 [Trypoxylus dichotomus]
MRNGLDTCNTVKAKKKAVEDKIVVIRKAVTSAQATISEVIVRHSSIIKAARIVVKEAVAALRAREQVVHIVMVMAVIKCIKAVDIILRDYYMVEILIVVNTKGTKKTTMVNIAKTRGWLWKTQSRSEVAITIIVVTPTLNQIDVIN